MKWSFCAEGPCDGPYRSGFPWNLKGNFHHVRSPGHPPAKGGGCPLIPSSRNPLRLHQPWLPNETVHLKKRKRWHISNLRDPTRSFCQQLCHCYNNKKKTTQLMCVISSRKCPVCSDDLGCCYCIHSDCGRLTPETFANQVQAACRGAVSPGGYGSQGWAPASHRDVLG